MSSFISRNKWVFISGLIVFFIELHFKFRVKDLTALMSAVLTLAATLTAIFVGFVSIILSLSSDEIFNKLNLDLTYLEKLMLGTVLYLLVSFEAIIAFFIDTKMNDFIFWYMNIWLASITMAFSVTCSLLKALFEFLHEKWKERRDREDLEK